MILDKRRVTGLTFAEHHHLKSLLKVRHNFVVGISTRIILRILGSAIKPHEIMFVEGHGGHGGDDCDSIVIHTTYWQLAIKLNVVSE